jgi:hypothetical protein
MGVTACCREFAHFLRGPVWVRMIAVFEPDLTTRMVIPEMRDNKALAVRWHPSGGNPGWRALVLRLAFACLFAQATLALAAEDFDWFTGPRFDQQLETHVQSLEWRSNPLRNALGSLARSQRTAIFLDRRVDPGQPVDFSVRNEALREVIQRLAQSLQLGVGRVGPVVYLGPPETANVLGEVVEMRRKEIRRWPPAVSKRLPTVQPAAWPELAEPRELILRLVRQSQLEIDGLEQVPHDLWPAADLPPLDFAEYLSLLLAGFGLTFEVDEAAPQIRLVALPTTVAGGSVAIGSHVERRNRDQTTGSPKTPPAAGGQVRYTLEVKHQPVGAVAKALAERLGLQIDYDPQIRDKLQELVSFRVQEVTLDDLLQALFRPAGLTYRIVGETMTVLAAPDGGS